jgi:hypothetical protein
MRTRIQDFDYQKFKNISAEEKKIFLIKNYNLFIQLSIKDVQATERPSAKKREHPAI